jgi:hypothetical protein
VDYDDHGLAAMPKLVGGPRYSRPPVVIPSRIERPPDPDDLPLVAEWTPEDVALAAELGLDATTTELAAPAFVTPPSLTAASADAGGHASSHPNGSWSTGSGSIATEISPARRGFGGLFRGRRDRSGAS